MRSADQVWLPFCICSLNLSPDRSGDLDAAADGQDYEFRRDDSTPVKQDIVPRAVIGLFREPRCSEFLFVIPAPMPHDLTFKALVAAIGARRSIDLVEGRLGVALDLASYGGVVDH
jgi:hypothetical protein